MTRALTFTLAGLLVVACASQKVVQASSTLEEEINEPVDAGAVAAVEDAGSAPAAEAGPSLVKVELPEGFSVMVPSTGKEPQIQRSSNAIKGGTVNTVLVLLNTGAAIFSATRVEYPPAVAKRAGAEKMLNETRTTLATQLKGEATVEGPVPLAGGPGQIFSVSGSENLLRARTAVVGNVLYTLVVVYKGALPAGGQEFLDSVAVTAVPGSTDGGVAAPAPAPAPAP